VTSRQGRIGTTDILVSQMFQELELAVCPLGQDGRAKRLHDLLDGDILVGELISG